MGRDLAVAETPIRPFSRKRTVTLNIARFWAGATVEEIVDTLLPDLKPYYDFVADDAPQILRPLFGRLAAGPLRQGFHRLREPAAVDG